MKVSTKVQRALAARQKAFTPGRGLHMPGSQNRHKTGMLGNRKQG